MALSNKKLKYLHRQAERKSPAEIAADLNVPLKVVRAELEKMQGKGEASINRIQRKEKILFWMLASFVFLAPFIVLRDFSNFADAPKKALIQIGGLALFGMWLFQQSRSPRIEIRKCSIYLPLAFVILWAFSSVFWAKDSYSAFIQWAHWAACGLVFFVSYHILDDSRKSNFILGLIFASATLVALLGLAQHIFEVDWVRQIAPPAATFANRNAASQYVVLTFPLGLIFFLAARRNTSIWIVSLAMASICAYLFHTFTRAGWLSVSGEIFLFIIYLAFRHYKLKSALISGGRKLIALGTACVVIILLANFSSQGWSWRGEEALNRFSSLWKGDLPDRNAPEETMVKGEEEYSSVLTRKTIYRNTLEIIKSHPWNGVGLDNFAVHYPASTLSGWQDKEIGLHKHQAKTHNDYLQITAELGAPAVAALICFVIALVRKFPVLFSRKLPENDRDTACACLIGILGLSANAIVSFPMYLAIPPFILAIYAAIFFRILGQENEGKDDKWVWENRKMATPGVILIALILAGWIFWQYRFFRSEYYYNLQSIGLRDRYYKESIHWGLKAQEWNPYRLDVQNYLGRALLKIEDRKGAIEHLERFHKSIPYATYNLYYLALGYKELNEYAKAKPLLDTAINILPDEGRLRDLMGWVYSGLNQPEKALEEFRLAAQLVPRKSNYHYNLGVTAFLLGRYEEAAEALQKSVALKDDYFLARKYLGKTLIQHLDRPEEGIPHLKKAIELSPDGKETQSLRKILEQINKMEP